jgi:hypothetical protein
MSQVDLNAVLARLGLSAMNPGAWSGAAGWSKNPADALINVRNPADGSLLAQVRPANSQDYEAVLSSAVEAARAWREVPAPRRGEAVRLLGEELRRHKQELGTLVSLENGKILAEGLGEVQEMIDIADFAVGQARMLYGLTMHSERPQHRRRDRHHLGLQLPGGGVVLERLPGRHLRQRQRVEALTEDPADGARGAVIVQPGDGARAAAAHLPAVHRFWYRARHALRR